MIGNRFYTWFKNYYQWVGGAFNETLLLPLVRATAGLRAGAIRYDQATNTVETYDGTNWNAIPSASGFVPNSRTITINGTTFDLSTNRIYSVGTVTSVGLSMPAAFTVSGSPVIGSGTLSVAGAGLASQYVRGDGTLANFPTTQGGGSSVSYYLNGSVNQGTIGGNTYYELNRTPVLGAGTNFSRNTDGYIASFITDANDPALTEIPGGNFNLELYFSASSGGGNPSFYVELYKYDGTTFSLIASNQSSPDTIVGSTKDAYFTALAVPQTTLAITDRLAIRVYVAVAGRTITLHTEDQNLCQIITTFSTGINTINGLTKQVQFLTTGTSGTDFNINSTNSTHTFNIPTASATNRGALSSADWTTFNNKVSTSRQLTINGTAFDLSADRSWNVGTVTSVGLDTGSAGTDINVSGSPVNVSGNITLNIPTASATNRGALSAADWAIFNAKQNALTLTTTGNSGASTLVGATLNIPEYTLSGLGGVPTTRTLTINGTALDLSANRSWSVGTVTSVGLTSATSGVTISDSPVTVSGTIGIAIATANGSQQGLLSGTDWTTFNNKQNALTLTTSGTSGAATLIGATLNVPQYQAQGNYITSLTGEATASGPGAASVTLSTTAVTGKLLAGLNLSGGGTIAATDSILTAFGKVQNQISAMVGGVMYQGTWNASTNTPTLTSSVGTKGNYYIVDVSGTTNLNGITDWRVGDWAIFNGSTWDKVDNTDAVSSVNGFTGAVSLTTSHIAEGTNLYYLDSRSRTAISLTTTGNSGAATYDNVSGIINVPQYTLAGLGGVPTTRQLTINGTAFDLSADRTWSVGTVTSVGLNSTTSGVTITNTPVTSSGALTINIATASGSQNGLLSSTDWTTFNSKQNALNGTGFVKISGTTISYDNSSYLPLTLTSTARIVELNGQTLEVYGSAGSFTSGRLIVDPTFGAIGYQTSGQFYGLAINTNGTATFSNTGVTRFMNQVRFDSTLTNGTNTYTLPSATGTLALTSAVSGSTGQVAYFNGTNSVTGESNLFWDAANDRLGIGTSSPATRLDVNGILRVSTTDQSTNRIRLHNQNSGQTWDIVGGLNGANNTDLSIFDGTTTRLVLNPSGNLGLGVTPSAWFSDRRAIQVQSGGSVNGSASTPSFVELGANFFHGSGGDTYISTTQATKYRQLSGAHEWYTAPSGTAGNAITFTQAMTLTAAGDFLIGSTSVPANGANTRNVVFHNSNNVSTFVKISNGTTGATASDGFDLIMGTSSEAYLYNRENGDMIFGTNNTERMRITNGGNVGIGTSAPTFRLDVQGGSIVNGNGTIQTALTYATMGIIGTLSNHDLAIYTNNTEKARITSGGNVGIGSTSPSVSLVVSNAGAAGFEFNPNSAGLAQLETYNRSTSAYVGFRINADDIRFHTGSGASERMRITSGGNVQINGGTLATGAIGGSGVGPAWKLGNTAAGTLTPTLSINVEINGTTYVIGAATV